MTVRRSYYNNMLYSYFLLSKHLVIKLMSSGLKNNLIEREFVIVNLSPPPLYSLYWFLYVHGEYLTIIKREFSWNVFLIISFFVFNYIIYFPLYLVLLTSWGFKSYLYNNTWIKDKYPALYKALLELTSLLITCLIIYFFLFYVIRNY